jgi:hypothetical protein
MELNWLYLSCLFIFDIFCGETNLDHKSYELYQYLYSGSDCPPKSSVPPLIFPIQNVELENT